MYCIVKYKRLSLLWITELGALLSLALLHAFIFLSLALSSRTIYICWLIIIQ